MVDKNESPSAPLPPYISYRTFTSFIKKLKGTTVPPRIDGSVLTNYAGSVARQLVLALKYLKLIHPNGVKTDKLKALVDAYDSDQWREILSELIADAYQEVTGDLDIESGTYQQLQEAFRSVGADGVLVLNRAIAFYLAAAEDAGWKDLSPHFKKPRRRPQRAKATSKGPRKQPISSGDDPEDLPPAPTGYARFNVPIPGKSAASLVLPPDLSSDDWDMIDSMVRAYVQRKDKASKK